MTENLHVKKALEMLGNSPLKLTSQRINLIKTLFQRMVISIFQQKMFTIKLKIQDLKSPWPLFIIV